MEVAKENLKGFREPTDLEHAEISKQFIPAVKQRVIICTIFCLLLVIIRILPAVRIVTLLMVLPSLLCNSYIWYYIGQKKYKVLNCRIISLNTIGEIGPGYNRTLNTEVKVITYEKEVCYNSFKLMNAKLEDELLLIKFSKIYKIFQK